MIERAIRQAMDKLGTRAEAAEAAGTCPVCGRPIKSGERSVRVWSSKHAHRRCASYDRRSRRRSPAIFTSRSP
jgi:hypothetical protein